MAAAAAADVVVDALVVDVVVVVQPTVISESSVAVVVVVGQDTAVDLAELQHLLMAVDLVVLPLQLPMVALLPMEAAAAMAAEAMATHPQAAVDSPGGKSTQYSPAPFVPFQIPFRLWSKIHRSGNKGVTGIDRPSAYVDTNSSLLFLSAR